MLKATPLGLTAGSEIEGPVGNVIEEPFNTPDFEEKQHKLDPEMLARVTKLNEILLKIDDPNYSVFEVARLIAVEMATISLLMASIDYDPAMQWKFKAYEMQIKCLTALGKQLNDADVLSRKDILNFDGPKFTYVLGEIIALFKQSMKDAAVEESLLTSVMKHYRDLMVANEATIRRETERIDSGKK